MIFDRINLVHIGYQQFAELKILLKNGKNSKVKNGEIH